MKIGDPLRRVSDVYNNRHVDCFDQTQDGDFLYRSCTVNVGRGLLYFGGDPINEIEIASFTPAQLRRGY